MNVVLRNFVNFAFDGVDGVGKSTLIDEYINSVKIKYNCSTLKIEKKVYSPITHEKFDAEKDKIDYEGNMYRYMDSYIVNRIVTKLEYDDHSNHRTYDNIIDPVQINLIDRGFLSTFFYGYLDTCGFMPLCDEPVITDSKRKEKAEEMAVLYIGFESVIRKRLFYILKNLKEFLDEYCKHILPTAYPDDVVSSMETATTFLVYNNIDKDEFIEKKHDGEKVVNLNDQYEVDTKFKRRLNSNVQLFENKVVELLNSKYHYVNPFIGDIVIFKNSYSNIYTNKEGKVLIPTKDEEILIPIKHEVAFLNSFINSVLTDNGINSLIMKDTFNCMNSNPYVPCYLNPVTI